MFSLIVDEEKHEGKIQGSVPNIEPFNYSYQYPNGIMSTPLMEARAAYDKVFRALEAHQNWFENSIPLIASENVPSPAVREAILSDFGNRYAEKVFGLLSLINK